MRINHDIGVLDMAKLLVIAPYKGLGDLFLEVNKTANKNIHVEVGNLYKGVMVAKNLDDQGYDVIISRGATGKIIREQCKTPVVDLHISGYDIMRTISLVQGYSGKIGAMSFLNIVQGTDMVGTLLGMNIQTYPVDSEEDIEPMVMRAKSEGVDLIIGDVITTTVAERFGINCILITSGREAVLDAIERAEEVAYYTGREKKLKESYEQVFEKCRDGIILVNTHATCLNINATAAAFLGVEKDNIIGEHFNDEVPFLNFKHVLNNGKNEKLNHIHLNNRVVDIEKIPIKIKDSITGAAIFLRESKTEVLNQYLYTDTEFRPVVQFGHLQARSPEMEKLIEATKRISKSNLPIIIYGEAGTGKKSLAQAIHNDSVRRDFPFYLVNCEELKAEKVEKLFFGLNDGDVGIWEICDKGTVCIENIHKLSFHNQVRLAEYLNNKSCGPNGETSDVRVVVLTTEHLMNFVDNNLLSKQLYQQIHAFHLTIPPLRERRDEMTDFIRKFIASANVKQGKQVVSLEDDVLQKLNQYDWPGNIAELKNTIEQMCFISEGPFIKLTEVEGIIQGMYMKSNGNKASIDISKTLDLIVKEVILRVMEEENQNQSKTAERLGINRSTLWRKLKGI